MGILSKMKYRIIFLILFPALIAASFVAYFLFQDFKNYRQMNKIKIITSFSDEIGDLVVSAQKEDDLSIIYLLSQDSISFKEIEKARGELDNHITLLKKNIRDNKGLILDGVYIQEIFKELLSELERIPDIRARVDRNEISINELTSAFDDIEKLLITKLILISRNTSNIEIATTLIAYVNLLQEQMYAGLERRILYQAFFKNELSPEGYKNLLIAIGKQEAFREIFFEVANTEQDALYSKSVKGSIIHETEQLRGHAIKNNTQGNFNVSPEQWWRAKTGEMEKLEAVEKIFIKEVLNLAQSIKRSVRNELIFTSSIIAITFVGTFIFIILNLRSLAHRLDNEVSTLSDSNKEILSSITDASSTTSETATALTETTTTVEELKQTAQASTDKAKNVADVANTAMTLLHENQQILEKTISGMKNIEEGMLTISESIVTLSEHSQAIGDIIDSVNDLAEQSHLLAVNAAIEAAKAGEQGKGFAVVAQEVRSLAEQSKLATVQVRKLLNNIQDSTSAAVMATEQGSKAVKEGMSQSKESNESIQSISSGITDVARAASQITVSSEQQLIGVGQVNVAMNNIKEASNQQVKNMAQIEGMLQNLKSVGNNLQTLVDDYKI